MKRIFYRLVGVGLVVFCVGVVTFPLYFWWFAEFEVEHGFQIYPASEKLFEVHAYDMTKLAQKNLYYWTEDDLIKVQNFYEQYYQPFKQGDRSRSWLITGINNDTSFFNGFRHSIVLDINDFCPSQENYKCAIISLIPLKTEKPENISTMLLPIGMQSKDNLEANIASLPSNGTLIVYNYFIANLT